MALGSNQGDCVALLRAAVRALPQVGVHVRAFSSLYETAPAYVTEQVRVVSGRHRRWQHAQYTSHSVYSPLSSTPR